MREGIWNIVNGKEKKSKKDLEKWENANNKGLAIIGLGLADNSSIMLT